MTSYQKKKFDKINQRNFYAKELLSDRNKYRKRIIEAKSKEEFIKQKVLKEYDIEDTD
jgi:hypothetical protein